MREQWRQMRSMIWSAVPVHLKGLLSGGVPDLDPVLQPGGELVARVGHAAVHKLRPMTVTGRCPRHATCGQERRPEDQ